MRAREKLLRNVRASKRAATPCAETLKNTHNMLRVLKMCRELMFLLAVLVVSRQSHVEAFPAASIRGRTSNTAPRHNLFSACFVAFPRVTPGSPLPFGTHPVGHTEGRATSF